MKEHSKTAQSHYATSLTSARNATSETQSRTSPLEAALLAGSRNGAKKEGESHTTTFLEKPSLWKPRYADPDNLPLVSREWRNGVQL